ncbi:MAG: UDP-3-O-[3-hydroxymyristoyl] N-acetylglucosamine deacetylase [Parvularculaceae bacterium]|nr:UDP-3-O-[3-hydroxymyristoyl] N-acetylglucosamine deacetylase [Parvularculaceae bacterium]
MRVIQQTTLAKPVSVSGAALHTGVDVTAVLRPAAAGAGVVFRRIDLEATSARQIPATPANVASTTLCTTLGAGPGAGDGVEIATTEHLLAALSLCGVDNAVIDVDASELPILDGSAGPYVEAINRAGLKPLGAPREVLRVMAPIELRDGDRFIRVEPYDGRVLDVSIDFPDAAIGRQTVSVDLDDRASIGRLTAARTFCRLGDIEAMRRAGLARGGSLDNAIVIDGARMINEAPLRDPHEFALHKALDLIGDLRLAGGHLVGAVTANKPGHDLNTRFAAMLDAERTRIERAAVSPGAVRMPA